MARYKFVPGTVIRIPLDGGVHVYARQLEISPFLAFYDCRTDIADPELAEIVNSPVLFVLAADDLVAVKDGRWTIIGSVALAAAPVRIPLRFMQSIGNPSKLRVIDAYGLITPATWDEVQGLERAAVWHAEHVIERLNDHYAGRPNIEVEQLKLIQPG
jgi:hypothetical protein